MRGLFTVLFGRFVVPCVPLIDGYAGVVSHGAVDVSGLRVGHISHHVIRAWLEFNLVEEHEFRVHVVANVPHTEQEFSVNFAVLIAGDIDGVQQVKLVLERDGSVGDIKQGLLGQRVDRRNQRERDVDGVGYVQVQRDVGDIIVDEGRFVEVVPAVIIDIASVVVIARWDGSVGEVAFFIGHDHHSSILAEFNVNPLNRLVGECIAVHVLQGVLEDRTGHGHVQVVARVNADFNGIWEEHFLAVGQLGDHVVGARKQTGLVERTGFHHWTGEGADTDEQARTVEGTRTFEQSGAFEGLALTGVGITVATGQR